MNPDGLKNQVEGAVAQGLGGALFEAVAFEGGHVDTAHFADYRLPRFSDMPIIETVLVDRKDLPSAGAGETPIVGIAPAVGNAIFDATGVRLRSLPLVPNGMPAGTGSSSSRLQTTDFRPQTRLQTTHENFAPNPGQSNTNDPAVVCYNLLFVLIQR